MTRRPAVLGFIAVFMVGFWQFLTVHYNYGGNSTGLFCIASHMPVPPFLKSERLYIFPNSEGYDGQVYHLIAHDPWVRRGAADAMIGPNVFYQRILVPALAWSLALGRDPWIHGAYYSVELGFVFLGVYWLSLFAAGAGLHPAWGLAFLVAPGTITSIDRMTIDVALAALTVAFALCAETGPRWKVLAVLTCAALTKEQALPMIAGYTLYLVTRRRFLDGVWAAMTALPAVAWFVYLAWRTPPAFAPPPERGIPFAGMVDAILHPLAYSFTPFKNAVGVTFDYIALAGFTIALVFTVRLLIQRRWDAQASAIYVLAAAALVVRNWVLWTNAYAFGRGFTPFLLLVALQDLGRRPWLALLPMLLVDARIGLNFIPQVMGVARGLSGL